MDKKQIFTQVIIIVSANLITEILIRILEQLF